MILGLEWIQKSGLNPGLVLKVDDDVMINPVRIWNLYREFRNGNADLSQADMIGPRLSSKPMRRPDAKWYLPVEFYQGDNLPPIVAGHSTIYAGRAVPDLYKCAMESDYVNLEDVMITGICGTEKLGMKIQHRQEEG